MNKAFLTRAGRALSSPLRLWMWTAGLALGVFLLTRLALLAHAWLQSGQALGELLAALPRGVLRDVPVALLLASPFALAELLPGWRWRQRLRMPLLGVYVFTLLLVAVAEIIFWDEFGVRFNFIALDYLVFTTEVVGNIRESYPVGTLITLLAGVSLMIVAWPGRRLVAWAAAGRRGPAASLGVMLTLLLVGVGAWRMAPPEFSRNGFANELADNGWRSFIWAARQNQLDYFQFYATRPAAQVLASLGRLAGRERLSATASHTHRVAHAGGSQPNVVVVMMESMSADYMGTFGDKRGLTPRLDRLASEGLLFTRMYATGTRTVRGLEALSAALPPMPGKAMMRHPGVHDLNTLGGYLADRGWSPHFLYGGYGVFDSMNDYFAAQGYQVTDRSRMDADLIRFTNIWGVADEDLFDQTLRLLDREHAAGRPVLAHVMTASNHVPFTYPDGRIDIPSPGGRNGAIKYSDHAIGYFLDQASRKPWFANTIFLFVADHCARSAGATRIPVYRYHIPAILYAPQLIPPGRVETLASQIDLVPTLLALLGQEADSRFIGRDILHEAPEAGRALLSTYQNLGYLKGDVLTVLLPKAKVEAYRVSPDGKEAVPIPVDGNLADEAIAYYQGTALLLARHFAGPAPRGSGSY